MLQVIQRVSKYMFKTCPYLSNDASDFLQKKNNKHSINDAARCEDNPGRRGRQDGTPPGSCYLAVHQQPDGEGDVQAAFGDL